MPNWTRREFLPSLGALGSTLLLSSQTAAIDPIRRNDKSHFKLSLAAYSFRQWLDLKKKPQPEMKLADFIDYSAQHALDAVELTAYYFSETSPEYLASLKAQATRLGLDISGTAVGNNFCVKESNRLKEQIQNVKNWVEYTARLGGKTIRIFAGNLAKGEEEVVAVKRCVEAIQECCDYSNKFGVYLALENHGGITASSEQLLGIVKAVNHPLFGVNLDTGNFRTADPYGDLEKLAPYAVTVQVKTDIAPAKKPMEETDIDRIFQMLRKINYRGYVALEYEGKEDPKVAVPKYLLQMREKMWKS